MRKLSYKSILGMALVLWMPCFCFSQEIEPLLDQAWENIELDPNASLEYLDEAIFLSRKQINEDKELEALEMKAIVFEELGYLNKASDLYLEVLERRSARNEAESKISLFLNLGILYAKLKQNKTSQGYYEQAIQVAEALNDSASISFAKNNLGTSYSIAGKYDQAISIFKELLDEATDSLDLGTYNSNIGLAFERKSVLDSAEVYNTKAVAYLDGVSEFRLAAVLNNMGSVYLKQEEYQKAREVLNQSRLLSEGYGLLELSQKNYQMLGEAYDLEGQHELASPNYTKALALKDSIQNVASAKYINTLNTVYELDKKEQAIEQLEVSNEEKEGTIQWLVIIIVLAALLLLALILWYRARINERKRTQELQEIKIKQQEENLQRYQEELKLQTNHLLEKNRALQEMKKEVLEANPAASENMDELLKSKILTNQDWSNYKRAYELVYPGFFGKLEKQVDGLTQGEQRTAALIKLELSNFEIADLLGISEKSVIQNKYRLRKKMELEDNDALFQFLQGF